MIEMADIREWRARVVVDAGGHRIGVLEAVYVDTGTDGPAMVTVQVGLPTRHRLVFVPFQCYGLPYQPVPNGERQLARR
ncbi:PRC-barrel domain-containing protein [Streptomyces sp. NPDC033754]|uniref:PRC-barrel domain-containing protein n=1 Tax=unclassified Streptomyces TaxID=2593676 RepID=UPI0033C3083C